jgi:hypothetical protein
MCKLTHLPLTVELELAKNGPLFKKVKFTLEQAMKTHMESKVIDLYL